MTQLLLGLSYLHEHKFYHNFQNCISPFCSCGMDIESTSQFFLHFPLFHDKRITILCNLSKSDCKLIETNESSLTERVLFGISLFDSKNNPLFLTSIDYILSTERFEELLLLLVSTTATKYSCKSNHSFTLSEFFNLFMVFTFI